MVSNNVPVSNSGGSGLPRGSLPTNSKGIGSRKVRIIRTAEISKASEASSLFGHLVWRWQNSQYKQGSNLGVSLKIKPTEIPEEQRARIAQIGNHCLSIVNPNKRKGPKGSQIPDSLIPQETRSSFFLLLEKILILLGIKDPKPVDFFFQQLNQGLDNGYCHGVSLEIIRLIKEYPQLSPDKIMEKVDTKNVAFYQVASDLRVQLETTRDYFQYCVDHFDKLEVTVDKIPSTEKTLSRTTIKIRDKEVFGLEEIPNAAEIGAASGIDVLRANVTACEQHLVELEQFLPQQPSVVEKFTGENSAEQAKIHLKENPGVYTVGLFPEKAGNEPGHALVLDLDQCQFFDENAGFYKFSTKEQCLDAFFSRAEKAYPTLFTGSWTCSKY